MKNLKNKVLSFYNNHYLTVDYTTGTIISSFGFFFLYWNSNTFSDFEKMFVVIIGTICLLLSGMTVLKYFKIVQRNILNEKLTNGKREFTFSLLTFVGLIVPSVITNYIFNCIVYLIKSLPSYENIFCTLRAALVNQYFTFNFFENFNNLIALIVVLNVVMYFTSIYRFRNEFS